MSFFIVTEKVFINLTTYPCARNSRMYLEFSLSVVNLQEIRIFRLLTIKSITTKVNQWMSALVATDNSIVQTVAELYNTSDGSYY